MVTEEQFQTITELSKDSAFDTLWWYLTWHENIFSHLPKEQCDTFAKKKNLFFYFLKRYLQEGSLKIAKNGQFIAGSIDEQIELFKKNFPHSDEMMDEEGVSGVWFFMDDCPGGAVWIHKNKDGIEYLEWT
jgi:hypothetical protein